MNMMQRLISCLVALPTCPLIYGLASHYLAQPTGRITPPCPKPDVTQTTVCDAEKKRRQVCAGVLFGHCWARPPW